MSRENEKVLAELRIFLELHNEELNDEKDFDRLAEQFLSQHNGSPDGGSMGEIETADDYLELAEQAASKKKRLNYLKKALELEPDHVDAQLQLILTEAEDAPEARLTALEDLIKKAAKPLEEEGCFERGTGAFWGIMETRPYMRVRREYLGSLIECGMMQLAIEECRQLLELCEGDNLGIRYLLMHLYAYTEDELHALALHRKYDAYEETQIHCTVAAKHRFSGIAYTGDRKYQCIILCPSDDDCLRILSHRTEAHTLAGEVCDKHQSNIEYRYIPATPDGVRSLRYIAAHTQDDILHAVFSDEEIAAAYGKDCDAVTNGVRAVEFCSCNLSKLMRYAGRDDIGVVCFEWQYDFVRQLWGGCINLRRILRDSMI